MTPKELYTIGKMYETNLRHLSSSQNPTAKENHNFVALIGTLKDVLQASLLRDTPRKHRIEVFRGTYPTIHKALEDLGCDYMEDITEVYIGENYKPIGLRIKNRVAYPPPEWHETDTKCLIHMYNALDIPLLVTEKSMN